MSKPPQDQSARLQTAMPQPARRAVSGERLWAIRERSGATLTCEFRDSGYGVEVQMLRDGERLFGRRWPNRAAALVEADGLKAAYIAAGCVDLPGL